MTDLQKAILALLTECVEKQDRDVDVLGHIERLKKIAYPCECDQHAELKAQYARDVETCKSIGGLDAWQLWQYFDDGEWNVVPMADPSWTYKTRRHPHAESIIEYHKGGERDKRRWQYSYRDAWIDCDGEPDWYEHTPAFRLKPETITIGGKEYAAPLRVAPENGTECFWYSSVYGVISMTWCGCKSDFDKLEKSLVFLGYVDCQAVADAFNTILSGDGND